MIIDCISDLHGHYPELEGGDLLIVAGDLTARDEPYQYIEFALWLNQQKYKYKILVGGNHDNKLQEWPRMFDDLDDFIYLCDSSIEFEGLKIWGSPWTLRFPGMNPHCMAFTVDTEEELAEKWELIPCDIDIIITHSPPKYIMDVVESGPYPENVGSLSLCAILKNTNHKLHVFGHIHEAYGKEELNRLSDDHKIICVNASHVNQHYEPVNKLIRIEL